MKRFSAVLLTAMTTLLLPITAHGAEAVTVALPSFSITLNDVAINYQNSQYPFLVYKDITYIPMTYEDAKLLGLVSEWNDENGLSINKSVYYDRDTSRNNYQGYPTTEVNNPTQTATIAQFPVTIAGKEIDNQTEEYPLLVFRDVTYFPLTWRFAVDEFGWKYQFSDEQGLTIAPPASVSTSTIVTPDDPKPTIDSSVTKVQVTADIVNIRTDANTSSEILTKVEIGDILDVLAVNGDWYQVLADDKIGWIAGWLVTPCQTNDTFTPSGNGHELTNGNLTFDGRIATAVFDVASESTATVTASSQNKVVITIDHLMLKDFTPLGAAGAITAIEGTQAGDKAILTVHTLDKATVTASLENNRLTITARDRYVNGGKGLSGKIIVIDPGHGNIKENGVVDPGTVGLVLGYTDREVGYAVGDKLRHLLEAQGAIVVMTREAEPTTVTLTDRPIIANQVGADAFVSIHGNALENNTTKQGAEVYYYAQQFLTPSAQKNSRQELAQAVNQGIADATGRSCVVKDFQNYVVLRNTECPSILVETGYLSNAEEEALLADSTYQQKIAQGIFDGLTQFFQ